MGRNFINLASIKSIAKKFVLDLTVRTFLVCTVRQNLL
jgi:hypothetical protein